MDWGTLGAVAGEVTVASATVAVYLVLGHW